VAEAAVAADKDAGDEYDDALGTEDDRRQLRAMGYRQELYRGFSGLMAFAFCFTAVSIIPSISLGLATGAYVGGPAVITWTWIVGGAFSIIAGCSLVEIASVYPSAGSVYHWSGQLGPPGPASRIASYTCGWLNLLGNAAGDAAFSSGFATVVAYAVSMADPEKELTVGAQVGISIAVLASWSLLDFTRSDQQGWVNNDLRSSGRSPPRWSSSSRCWRWRRRAPPASPSSATATTTSASCPRRRRARTRACRCRATRSSWA